MHTEQVNIFERIDILKNDTRKNKYSYHICNRSIKRVKRMWSVKIKSRKRGSRINWIRVKSGITVLCFCTCTYINVIVFPCLICCKNIIILLSFCEETYIQMFI